MRSMDYKRTLRILASKQAASDAAMPAKPRSVREESKNEREAEYHPQGYGLYFCFHKRSYYEPCTKCKRTRREAQRNILSL